MAKFVKFYIDVDGLTDHKTVVDGEGTKGENTLTICKRWFSGSQSSPLYRINGLPVETLYVDGRPAHDFLVVYSYGSWDKRRGSVTINNLGGFVDYCNQIGLNIEIVYRTATKYSNVGGEFFDDKPMTGGEAIKPKDLPSVSKGDQLKDEIRTFLQVLTDTETLETNDHLIAQDLLERLGGIDD